MKRFCLFITFTLSVLFSGPNVFAQLNITGIVEEKAPERLLTCQVTYSWLYSVNGNYEYWALTDNQFDSSLTRVFLGDSPETATATLNDIIQLMEKEVTGVEVQQLSGNLFLTFVKQLGNPMLWIKQDGNAGRSLISIPICKRIIKYLSKTQAQPSDENQIY